MIRPRLYNKTVPQELYDLRSNAATIQGNIYTCTDEKSTWENIWALQGFSSPASPSTNFKHTDLQQASMLSIETWLEWLGWCRDKTRSGLSGLSKSPVISTHILQRLVDPKPEVPSADP